MRMRKKKWVDAFLESEDHYLIRNREELQFKKTNILEIGMGMGDFITQSAKANPDTQFFGFEKVDQCVAHAIKKAADLELDNLRIIMDDASNLEDYFDHQIDKIYLFFSDPWPKKRQAKRRLTYRAFIERYEKILKSDGELIFKSDNRQLFEFTLKEFSHFDFYLEDVSLDLPLAEDSPISAYEMRFRKLGQPIYFAHYKRSKHEFGKQL